MSRSLEVIVDVGSTGGGAAAGTAHSRSTATRGVTGLVDGERSGVPRWLPEDAAGRVASEGRRHARRRTNSPQCEWG